MYKKKIFKGNAIRPRLIVSRSSRHFYVQLVDDEKMHTMLSSSTLALKLKNKNKDSVTQVANDISAKMIDKGITAIIFDRNGNKYLPNDKKDSNKINGNIALLASIIRSQNIRI